MYPPTYENFKFKNVFHIIRKQIFFNLLICVGTITKWIWIVGVAAVSPGMYNSCKTAEMRMFDGLYSDTPRFREPTSEVSSCIIHNASCISNTQWPQTMCFHTSIFCFGILFLVVTVYDTKQYHFHSKRNSTLKKKERCHPSFLYLKFPLN